MRRNSASQTWNNKSTGSPVLSSGKSEQISNSEEYEGKKMEAWLPEAGMIETKK
jgi:hypothetical protein